MRVRAPPRRGTIPEGPAARSWSSRPNAVASVTLAGAAAGAAAKVRRRCPYVFGRDPGPVPDRDAEEAAWRRAKAEEKAARAAGKPPPPDPAPPRTPNPLVERLGVFAVALGVFGCGFALGKGLGGGGGGA